MDHVRAHRAHEHNEIADRLATQGAEGTVWGVGPRWAGWPIHGPFSVGLRHACVSIVGRPVETCRNTKILSFAALFVSVVEGVAET